MDYIINLITANTFTLLAAIIIGLMIVLAIAKRFIRLFAVAVVILLCYAGYLYYTGQKVPMNEKEIEEHITEKFRASGISEKAGDFSEKIQNKAKDKVKEEVKKEVKKEVSRELEENSVR